MIYLSLLAYVFGCYRLIFGYRKVVKQTTSINQSIDLNWLMWAVTMFSGVLFADVFQQILPSSAPAWLSSSVHLAVFILILALVYGMFFRGIRQPQIFMGIEPVQIQEVDWNQSKHEEKKMPDPESEELILRLKQYMEAEQPFLDPSLSINQLSSQVGIPMRKLSQLINQHLEQNFVDFINTYRIQLAKERLANPKDEKETVLEVMYEVGFNSKSSFNTKFKEKIGLTPTEFRNQLIPKK